MKNILKILLLLIILILTIGIVSASDDNSTGDSVLLNEDDSGSESLMLNDDDSGSESLMLNDDDSGSESLMLNDDDSGSEPLSLDDNQSTLSQSKQVPVISISSSSAHPGESIDIYLKDKNNAPLSNQNLTASIKNINKKLVTNSKGKATLKLNLKSGSYLLNVNFAGNDNFASVNKSFTVKLQKYHPAVTPVSTTVVRGNYFYIYLKTAEGNKPVANQKISFIVNDKTYKVVTDKQGKAGLKINLAGGTYKIKISFAGNENVTRTNKSFSVKVLKCNSAITLMSKTVIKDKYLGAYLKDKNGNALANKPVTVKLNGKTYNLQTNDKGKVAMKVTLGIGKYPLEITFNGDKYFNGASKKTTLIVPYMTTLQIGNERLLTNGYLRIYLKSSAFAAMTKKTLTITVGKNVFTKTTNLEGIVSFKPNAGTGSIKVTVKFKGNSQVVPCSAQKTVTGIKGDVKNPLKTKIALRNGVPDIDLMPGDYVMGDGDMTYSLNSAQYKEVLKRESHCLFLNNKLSKYEIFKSKREPNTNHIIKREKWNVIEREINKQIVLKNKHGYWPTKITVSLKGKSYTYPEVRDEQNTGYTCGPTSCSFCSQVLRNYVNEAYLAVQAGSSPYSGSSTSGLKAALERNNFKCSVYYKSSFDHALNELKKGGCALVFHTWNHYVSILDISKDGKMVLVGNPSGDYDHGSHGIPTKWLSVSYMKGMFNNYDTSGLIVKLNYNLNANTKNSINNMYASMGANWARQNTNERIPQL